MIHWYDLSEVETEELVKDSISCMRFFYFRLQDQISDYTTLYRFHNKIVSRTHMIAYLKRSIRN
ncbi:MAG: transposase [Flavobacteriales bacterium Tduv]